MKKIRKKITEWLLNKLLKNEDAILQLDYSIFLLVHTFYKESELDDSMQKDRKLDKIIFNAKYRDFMEGEDTPYNLLQEYFRMAGSGSKAFYRHYFYKVLRLHNDTNISKLRYKLKRNGG